MPHRIWRILGGRTLLPQTPFGIMGIINCTPNSFLPWSRTEQVANALARARALRDEGADILDLGGESTAPNAEEIKAQIECNRLLPVVMALRHTASAAVLSIDTWRARTARCLLERGAAIINDVSGAQWDPDLLDCLVDYAPGYVLTHAQPSFARRHEIPDCKDILSHVCRFFERALNRLTAAGLPEDHIVLDPGIGFGKTLAHNCTLLKNIKALSVFGRPLLLGLSHKRFLGDLLGLPPEQRNCATQIATVLQWQNGVFWHRVHCVAETRQALLLASHLSKNPAPPAHLGR